MGLVATCVWLPRPALAEALSPRLGPPDDSYGNGSQAWLRSDGPGGLPVEWRLHPRPDFVRPPGVPDHELFQTVTAPAPGNPPLDPLEVWAGLEAAPAYGDEVEADELVARLTEVLGLVPDLAGPVDRDAVGRAWERSGGRLDVVARLVEDLTPEL